jgi:hypothetical protein
LVFPRKKKSTKKDKSKLEHAVSEVTHTEPQDDVIWVEQTEAERKFQQKQRERVGSSASLSHRFSNSLYFSATSKDFKDCRKVT